jgi:hypothetical protein
VISAACMKLSSSGGALHTDGQKVPGSDSRNVAAQTRGTAIWPPAAFCRSMAAMLLDDIFGNRMRLIRTDIGYQIGRHVGIKGVHCHLVGGVSAKADEAVGPHQDRPTFRDAGCGRVEWRGRRIDK